MDSNDVEVLVSVGNPRERAFKIAPLTFLLLAGCSPVLPISPDGNTEDAFLSDASSHDTLSLDLTADAASASWNLIPSGTTADLYGVSFSGWGLTAVGAAGTIVTSSDDGQTWTQQVSGTNETLYAVAAGIAVGGKGTILLSNDGKTWARAVSPVAADLYGIGWFSEFDVLAVGANGEILRSSDGGKIWSRRASGTQRALYSVQGIIAQSSNAIWEPEYAVGEGGTILQADWKNGDVLAWNVISSGTASTLRAVGLQRLSSQGSAPFFRFLAAGDSGTVVVGLDGPQATVSVGPENLRGLSVHGEYAVGAVGTVYRWNDLAKGDPMTGFAREVSVTTSDLFAVCYKYDGFRSEHLVAAVGAKGVIIVRRAPRA